jgi:5-methylcytosine-specific restriction endonuclease McrA
MKFSDEYINYINSDEWQAFRKRALAAFGNKCVRCEAPGSDVILQVHHLSYRRLGRERLEDVTVLCVPCHESKHKRWKGKRIHVKKDARRRTETI